MPPTEDPDLVPPPTDGSTKETLPPPGEPTNYPTQGDTDLASRLKAELRLTTPPATSTISSLPDLPDMSITPLDVINTLLARYESRLDSTQIQLQKALKACLAIVTKLMVLKQQILYKKIAERTLKQNIKSYREMTTYIDHSKRDANKIDHGHELERPRPASFRVATGEVIRDRIWTIIKIQREKAYRNNRVQWLHSKEKTIMIVIRMCRAQIRVIHGDRGDEAVRVGEVQEGNSRNVEVSEGGSFEEGEAAELVGEAVGGWDLYA
ncbi:hypothetical protein K504DRAFT_456187 [Pleomassaria siparia CBS 279.74]|uniref:Uncharacterized protein n=1 Tax=Pleomassaria siparia CBS 279.74 TaxID=1314801 RepID=A0A6G1K5V0_9PLEO|nr:hypothetical protein K504DRAFT_456187 [Pleomassaria siparia CBS 279.74]